MKFTKIYSQRVNTNLHYNKSLAQTIFWKGDIIGYWKRSSRFLYIFDRISKRTAALEIILKAVTV